MIKEGLSRRSFLRNTAVGSTGAALASLPMTHAAAASVARTCFVGSRPFVVDWGRTAPTTRTEVGVATGPVPDCKISAKTIGHHVPYPTANP